MKNDSNNSQISCHLIFSFQLHLHKELHLVDHHFFISSSYFLVCKRKRSRVASREKIKVPQVSIKVWCCTPEPENTLNLNHFVLFECCAADTCWTKHTLSLLLQIKL